MLVKTQCFRFTNKGRKTLLHPQALTIHTMPHNATVEDLRKFQKTLQYTFAATFFLGHKKFSVVPGELQTNTIKLQEKHSRISTKNVIDVKM